MAKNFFISGESFLQKLFYTIREQSLVILSRIAEKARQYYPTSVYQQDLHEIKDCVSPYENAAALKNTNCNLF